MFQNKMKFFFSKMIFHTCINWVGTLMKHILMDSLDIFVYKSTRKNSGKQQFAKVCGIMVVGKQVLRPIAMRKPDDR